MGCGHAFLPQPTKKAVSALDIVGIWQYEINPGLWKEFPKNDGIIKIEFAPDGTFQQEIIIKGTFQPIIQKGHWKINGAYINLTGILMGVYYQDEIQWAPSDSSWWIIDSHHKGAWFSIFGGTSLDPDQNQEFKKLPTSPSPGPNPPPPASS
jgi:hypothetical protein